MTELSQNHDALTDDNVQALSDREIVSRMNNPLAEQNVIGSLLVDPSMMENTNLIAEDFSDHHLRRIYSLMQDGYTDYATLSDQLAMDSHGKKSVDSIIDFLYAMANGAVSGDLYFKNVEIVSRQASRRKMVAFAAEVRASSQQDMSIEDMMAAISTKYDKVTSSVRTKDKGARSLHEVARDFVEKSKNNDAPASGVKTGFDQVDEIITMMKGGDLVILGGRPGMGKTALAMGIAENAAIKQQIGVAIFSIEMADEQLAMRSLSGLAKIDGRVMRSGEFSSHELEDLDVAVTELDGVKIYIDDKSGLTPSQAISRAKKMAEKYDIGLVILDYLQLMGKDDQRASTRDHVSAASGAMKGLAKDLNVPLIALSQLSRDLEKRVDKRPTPADLRDSGAIEQDADLIMFVYRDEVYHSDSLDVGIMEIIIAKNRSGPVGTARVKFIGEHGSRIENLYENEDFYKNAA